MGQVPGKSNPVTVILWSHYQSEVYFRVIMNEACHITYMKGSKLTLRQAGALYSLLGRSFVDLPGPLQPRMITLPRHLQLQ